MTVTNVEQELPLHIRQANDFNEATWNEKPLPYSQAECLSFANAFCEAFNSVYDNWVGEKYNFDLRVRIQIVEEVFEKMSIYKQFTSGAITFIIDDEQLATMKRRAVNALTFAIISDFNRNKKPFINHLGTLLWMRLYQYNFEPGSRGPFVPITKVVTGTTGFKRNFNQTHKNK